MAAATGACHAYTSTRAAASAAAASLSSHSPPPPPPWAVPRSTAQPPAAGAAASFAGAGAAVTAAAYAQSGRWFAPAAASSPPPPPPQQQQREQQRYPTAAGARGRATFGGPGLGGVQPKWSVAPNDALRYRYCEAQALLTNPCVSAASSRRYSHYVCVCLLRWRLALQPICIRKALVVLPVMSSTRRFRPPPLSNRLF